VTAPEERLAKLADLLSECPPPDIAGGYDQCAHGTWPCVITQAAWLAQGRDRDQEVRAACQAAARKAELEQAGWGVCQELRLPGGKDTAPTGTPKPNLGLGEP
jgi:hypothetical protein